MSAHRRNDGAVHNRGTVSNLSQPKESPVRRGMENGALENGVAGSEAEASPGSGIFDDRMGKAGGTPDHSSSAVQDSPPVFYGHDPSLRMHLSAIPEGKQQQLAEVPPDVDRTAFLLGQSSALQHCFQQALPRQQSLGSLQAQVDDLRIASGEEIGRVRLVENAGAALQEAIRSLEKRFADLERERLPRLEGLNGELRSEVCTVKKDFEKVIEETREGNLQRLLVATGRQLLRSLWGIGTQVDGLLLSTAQHVLLDKKARKQDSSELTAGDKRRMILGSTALIGLVECIWRLDQRIRYRTGIAGAPLRFATAPLSSALRISRGTIWAAAFILCASQLKQYSFGFADHWSNSLMISLMSRVYAHLLKMFCGSPNKPPEEPDTSKLQTGTDDPVKLLGEA